MSFRARDWLGVGFAGLALFALFAALYVAGAFDAADAAVGAALLGARGFVLAAGALAFLGGASFVIPVSIAAAVALALFGRHWGAARVLVIPAAADSAARGVKLLFDRPRPVESLVEAGGYSFPSGHATLAASLAVLAAWFATRHLKPRGLVVALLALGVAGAVVVSASRLVLGVHFFSDVLAGLAFGAGLAGVLLGASIMLERRVKARRRQGSP